MQGLTVCRRAGRRAPAGRGRASALKRALTLLGTLVLLAVPSSAQAFSKAIWGPITRNGVNEFPLYHRLGVSIYELALQWDLAAPTRPAHPTNPHDPAYRWPAEIQQAINQARRFHMSVMLQLIHTPAWASGHTDPTWSPRHVSDFAAFATAAARRYGRVHLWMVWGEPDRQGNFHPLVAAPPETRLNSAQKAGPHKYAQMLDAAYGALKRVSRKNLVIGGNTFTNGMVDVRQWISNLRLPNGRPPRMDMYGHNPFSYSDPLFSAPTSPFDQVQYHDLPELARWVDRYLHRGLPLFLSEWTIPTRPDYEFDFYVDPPVAARWVTEALRESRRWHRIYALGWIHVYDDPPESYGGLLTAAGKQKPDYRAFARG